MLIGIDASRAIKPQKTGTEFYSQEIIKALSRIDKKNKYLLYSPIKPQREFESTLGKNFSWKIMPFPKLWSQIRLSWELLAGKPKPDVVFEPAHTIPIFHNKKMVVTIHDLGFRYYPELYTPFERSYHNFSAKFSASHSAHIIAISQYTKKDILRHYSVNAEKITAIHHGFDKSKFRPAKRNELLAALPFRIRKPYIFFVGRLERKKNLSGMLEAYRILKKDPNFKHQLVLGGKPGFGYEEIIKNKTEGVIETGYLNDANYCLLLKNADIFLFTSFFEGFGMPVVEAMSCGVPVVLSNVTSLPEVAGGAGLLVNPRNPAEIATGLEKLIKNPPLRREFIKKGLDRVKKFSWEMAAKKTLEILEKVGRA